MLEINAERVIEASAEEVWAVLTNLDEFRQWNPFIRDARGTPVVGNPVHVRVESSFGLPLRFAATVTEREPNHLLRWRGQVLAGWFARGDHSFTIERLGKRRVRFIQHEAFSGLLPR
ncbi:MAG: SRPBCC domain-containing protein, partial [Proteobacteria bacterium]|nr:SRPBCC domain-containing protein [Pseudomonadota bacterium]